MERQPANRIDERITQMVSALREEPMPAPPTQLRERPQRTRNLRPGIAFGCAALALTIGAFAVAPRSSAAAELREMIQKASLHKEGSISYVYQIQPDGTRKLESKYATQGLNRHFQFFDSDVAETWIINGIQTNYWKKNGMATQYKTWGTVQPQDVAITLAKVLDSDYGDQASVEKIGKVEWKGLTLDRYEIRGSIPSATGRLKIKATVLADTETNTLYAHEMEMEGQPKTEMELTYPRDMKAEFEIRYPKTTRVYYPDQAREEVRRSLTSSLGTDTVDGIQVKLITAVVGDDKGGIAVLTTGGTGRIERDSAGIRVNGKEADGAMSANVNQGHFADGTWDKGGLYVFEPRRYLNMDLIYQESSFEERLPEVVDIEVPVWKADNSRYGRHLAGYAKFKHVVPIRAQFAGQPFRDGQDNRSIFDQTQGPIVETKAIKADR